MKIIPVLLLSIYAIVVTYFYVDIWSQYSSFAEGEIGKIQWVESVDCTMHPFARKINCIISTNSWSVADVANNISCGAN